MLATVPALATTPAAGRTHAGAVRAVNEDAFLLRPEIGLWAVADGMGGHADGAGASRRVVEALSALGTPPSAHVLLDAVRVALEGVDAALNAVAAESGGALSGSTVVALMVSEGFWACLWAGDSRLHRLRAGALERLTRDDSLVQNLIDAGVLTPERARHDRRGHILTRALGCGAAVRLNFAEGRIEAGDRFLLSSDGLTNALDAATTAALLGRPEAADALVEAALAARAADNVTAVVVAP